MESLTVELPEGLRRYAEEQAAERGLGTPGAYVVAVLREDQKQKAKARLVALVREGIESGPAVEMTPEDWADIRREVRERIEQEHLVR